VDHVVNLYRDNHRDPRGRHVSGFRAPGERGYLLTVPLVPRRDLADLKFGDRRSSVMPITAPGAEGDQGRQAWLIQAKVGAANHSLLDRDDRSHSAVVLMPLRMPVGKVGEGGPQ
jgi:hypothetical protein